jgi:formylglycine-generating enzyme required for sulfatase activity
MSLLAALLIAPVSEAARTDAGEAPFEAFAAEILDGIATPEAQPGTMRLRIAVWPFSKDQTPIPATLANEFNQRLLAALARRGQGRYRFVARQALATVVREINELGAYETDAGDPTADLMRKARVDVLVVGTLRRAGSYVVLSYKAVGVADGTIFATTEPRRLPVDRRSASYTVATLTLDQGIDAAARYLADRAPDLRRLRLDGMRHRDGGPVTALGAYLEERLADALKQAFAKPLTGTMLTVIKEGDSAGGKAHMLSGTYWDFRDSLEVRFSLTAPDGASAAWRDRIRVDSVPPGFGVRIATAPSRASVAALPETPTAAPGTVLAPIPPRRLPAAPAAKPTTSPAPWPVLAGRRVTVAETQRLLAELGYDPGPANGLLNGRTRSAIVAYQRDRGLAVNGRMTRRVVESLRRAEPAPLQRPFAVAGPTLVPPKNEPRLVRPSPMPPSGTRLRDCAECPELVVVPAGTFLMGGTRDRPAEQPARRVHIRLPFAVGRFEVTFAQWQACVDDGGCGGYRPEDPGWGRRDRPVINVSWDDASAYARWLTRKTGESYRLLSEAEWEYAARANALTPYWWGADMRRDLANCEGCPSPFYDNNTARVGSFRPNPFGLHDMNGNAAEWTADCWRAGYRDTPSDARPRTTGGDCRRRVVRGGSWMSGAEEVESTHRDRAETTARSLAIGFRVARALGGTETGR